MGKRNMQLSITMTILFVVFVVGCSGMGVESTGTGDRMILPLKDVQATGQDHHYSCEYDGIKHDFAVYLPDEPNTETPLIVMLHGYGQNAESFRTQTHMEEEANQRGYAVVYVTGASDPDDRTSAAGWNSGLRESNKDDVGFLIALAHYVQHEYQLGQDRTFAVGFSNGAFMTHRLAMEASDTFQAVASVAGMMPEQIWHERTETATVGVLQINGTKDDAVPMKLNGSDRYAKAPAIEDVIAYWAEANGLDQISIEQLSDKAEATKYSDTTGKNTVWHVLITDGYHSWPQEHLAGFNPNALILDFFDGYL